MATWLGGLATGPLLLVLTNEAAAQSSIAPPPQLQSLLACRQVADAGERLACFDRQAAAFEEARAKREVVVVDREQVRSSQRSIFGLTLPRIPLLGNGGSRGEDEAAGVPNEISGTIRSVRETREGKWLVGVDEAVWQTTEVAVFEGPPRVGTKVTIRRGSLGSFILVPEGRRGLRAIRLR